MVYVTFLEILTSIIIMHILNYNVIRIVPTTACLCMMTQCGVVKICHQMPSSMTRVCSV